MNAGVKYIAKCNVLLILKYLELGDKAVIWY